MSGTINDFYDALKALYGECDVKMPHFEYRDEVQKLLRTILITRKKSLTAGVPLAQLDQEYKDQTGTRIPFRLLGYDCLLDYLLTLRDDLSIEYQNGMYRAHPVVAVGESRKVVASPRFSRNESDCEDDFGPRVASSGKTVTKSQRNVSQPREIQRFKGSDKFADEECSEAKTVKPVIENYDNDDKESIAALINDRTRIRLQKLIEKYPNGIWCAELPTLYQKEYTIPLNYEELGFNSVIDYALHLPEIFHNARPLDKGDFKLYNAKATKPNIKEAERQKAPSLAALHNIYEQYVEPTEALPTVLSKTTIDRLIPDGVMRTGETVPQICVAELNRGIHEYIDVVVVEVYTPSFFWIQLLKHMEKFNEFMKELHEFYSIHAKKYSMPIAVMERGMNCACMYDEKWHRAMIKSVLPDNSIKIEFYDYGTIKSYPASCIHFLHRSFENLAAQAIPCGLYNVKPVNDTRWPWNVSSEFVNHATNEALVATIVSTDTNNNSMLIGLTNTQGDEDFHINDWMVQSGLAVYGKMGETVDMKDRSSSLLQSKQVRSVKSDGGVRSELSTIIEEDHQQRLVEHFRINNEINEAAPVFQRHQNECIRLAIRRLQSELELCAGNGARAEPASIKCFEELVKFFRSIYPTSNIETTTTTTKSTENGQTSAIPSSSENRVFTRYDDINEKTTINVIDHSDKRNDDCDDPAKFHSLLDQSGRRDETFDARASKIFQQFFNDLSPTTEPCSKNFFDDFAPSPSDESASLVADSSANVDAKFDTEKQRLFETTLIESAKNFFTRMEAAASAGPKKTHESSNVRLCDTNPFGCYVSRVSAAPSLPEKSSSGRSRDLPDSQAESPNSGYESRDDDETRDKRSNEIYEFRSEREKLLATRRLGAETPFVDDSKNPFSNNYVPPTIPPRTMNFASSRATANVISRNDAEMFVYGFTDSSCELMSTERNVAIEDSFGFARNDGKSTKLANSRVNGNGTLNDDESSKGACKIESRYTWEGKNYDERRNARKVQLTRSIVFLITYENEGWIAVDEFAAAFANKLFQAIMIVPQILKLQDDEILFLTIFRSENSSLFDELDRTSLSVPRDHENKIGDFLNLIPLKKALKILLEMKIIEREQIDRAAKHKIFPNDSSVLFDIYTLINAWGEVSQAMNLTE